MSIMKKPVLLVVSFGTSFADALEKNITAIEKALAEAFPAYEVRRAFTSGMILKKLRERDGIHIDSVSEAMERLARDGVQQVVVQPTHVMNGGEYDKMVEIVRAYVDRFQSLKIGRALLSDDHDMEAMIETWSLPTQLWSIWGTARIMKPTAATPVCRKSYAPKVIEISLSARWNPRPPWRMCFVTCSRGAFTGWCCYR